MKHQDVLVLRIALSVESAEGATVTVEPEVPDTSQASQASPAVPAETSEGPGEKPPPPPFRGRDTSPNEARTGDNRAMSDAQRRALFRIAYDLGDRETALDRILEALGVGRLEWATRAQASQAIGLLNAQRNGKPRPTNGARHG